MIIVIKISLIFHLNDIVLWNKITIEQNSMWRAELHPTIILNEFTVISFMSLRHEIRVWVILEKESIFSFKKNCFWPHHMASRIVVPQPGIEHSPMEVKARAPNHSTAREFPPFYYCYYSRFIWKILDCYHIESVNMFSHSFTGKVLE